MTFCVWQERPPFEFGPKDAEKIYAVGSVFVVTDDPKLATQETVDAVLNPPIAKPARTSLDYVISYIAAKADAPQELKDAAAAQAKLEDVSVDEVKFDAKGA